MTENIHISLLASLFAKWAGKQAENITTLPEAGSHRRYFRLSGSGKTAVGAYGSDLLENRAFFTINEQLRRQGVNVPELYAVADDECHYLMQDFGDESLFSILQKQSEAKNLPLLQKVVEQLADLQIRGAQDFDFSQCYPVAAFDRTSVFWDLNYFKYCFLKASGVDIDEVALERDFNVLADHLLEADVSFFMYRDFQSRNIMVQNDTLGFIDFQGGRCGPLQYDLASFLFQAKAGFSENLRESLLQHYIKAVAKYIPVDNEKFSRSYYSFVLFRTLQVLGVYGLRGIVERKPHFLESIPFALKNTQWIIKSGKLQALDISYLLEVLSYIQNTKFNHQASEIAASKVEIQTPESMMIQLSSFSYKNGYPEDESSHGGGYVFDCRGLNNPGRVLDLRDYTGLDPCIADYLKQHSQVEIFLQSVYALVSLSVDNYLERGFSQLSVSFGCTGGQHRSVYCAERTAAFLRNKYPTVKVIVTHRELATLKSNTKAMIEEFT